MDMLAATAPMASTKRPWTRSFSSPGSSSVTEGAGGGGDAVGRRHHAHEELHHQLDAHAILVISALSRVR